MRRFKAGDRAVVIKPLCVRRHNGEIVNFKNKIVVIKKAELLRCSCDLGLSFPVYIPSTHLEKIA